MRRKLIAFLMAVGLIAAVAACNPRQPDGGNAAAAPYGPLTDWNDSSVFPIGVWLERVDSSADCALLESQGFNFLGGIQANSNLTAANACGLKLLVQVNEIGVDNLTPGHPAYDGYFLYDEADMTYGPGSDGWTGEEGWNTCIPIQDQGGQCGYTVMQAMENEVPEGFLKWANYGKGVLEWETDQQASGFVNGAWATDVVSADKYWFTDPTIAAADRKGAKYGDDIARMRHLDGLSGGTAPADRQPIWAVIEAGHPFTEPSPQSLTITPAQMQSAAWHAVIGGARGIEWFVHNFNEPWGMVTRNCETACTANRDAMASINARLNQLATVLNSDYADNYVTPSSNIRAMAKIGGNDAAFGNGIYTFAGAGWSEFTNPGPQTGTLTFQQNTNPNTGQPYGCPSAATVLYESRTVPVTTIGPGQCRITDTFADGNAVHIYHQAFSG